MHAPFQVLVFPFVLTAEGVRYAVFRRSDFDEETWQGIAGGGEDDETAEQAAGREAWEEAGIPIGRPLVCLDSMITIPVPFVRGWLWGPETLVIPEYAFGIELPAMDVTLSHEHTEVRWLDFESAFALLRWDGNRNALWELNHRLMALEPP